MNSFVGPIASGLLCISSLRALTLSLNFSDDLVAELFTDTFDFMCLAGAVRSRLHVIRLGCIFEGASSCDISLCEALFGGCSCISSDAVVLGLFVSMRAVDFESSELAIDTIDGHSAE